MSAYSRQSADGLALSKADPRDLPIAIWLLCLAAMIFVMALIGAVTRLTESGLSIMEWAPLMGVLPPMSAEEWERIFALYREIPEYQTENQGMTLAEFKTIFWWEYIHRLWGRLIGAVLLIGFLWFLIRGQLRPALAPHLIIMFILGGLQGALGWYMVASGFAERTDVSQYRLSAHLIAALVIYAYVFWVAASLLRPAPRPSADLHWPSLKAALWLLCLLVFVTIASGGLVAGLDAGLIYNTFPLMGENLVPSDYSELTPFSSNFFENISAVQFNHRVLAIVTLLAALLIWIWSKKFSLAPEVHRGLDLVALMALLQVGLGIATLLLVVPLPLAVAHQGGAILLLTAIIWALRQMPVETRL